MSAATRAEGMRGGETFLPRMRAPASRLLWTGAALLTAAAVLFPVVMLLRLASDGPLDLWAHLLRHVLPPIALETALLLGGIGIVVVAIGTAGAWLVTAYDFPGRRLLDWALLMPLAVPAYIIAYVYGDLLHPTGPLQSALRHTLGLARPADLPLPDIRSMGGAVILFGLVLYPYVYLTTRALFLVQSASVIEIARTLGVTRALVFWRVALPLARPAIAVGAGLALMEALNDVGAASLLGVQPLTVAIYSTWINQSDLAGAAQIALALFALVLCLIAVERWGRRGRSYAIGAQRPRLLTRARMAGPRGWLMLAAGLVPVSLGFVIPFAYLAQHAAERLSFAGLSASIVEEAANTLAIAALATLLAVTIGLVVVYAGRLVGGAPGPIGRVASIGYAVPGTVLALGLLPLNGWFASLAPDSNFPFIAVLAAGGVVYAYVVRFLAIPLGGTEAGFSRIPVSLDHVARTLGQRPGGMLRRIHLPLAAPSIAAAAILTFVDCMKELPIALLLRPLNMETLATHLYGEAIRGTYEDGAVAALLIVLVGLIPVVLLSRVAGQAETRRDALL